MFEVFTYSSEDTRRWGTITGNVLRRADVVCLFGSLGAGKTTFAQGIARGLGVTANVTSPTFNLVSEYEGRVPFFHIDAYRLHNIEEAYSIGLEEYFYSGGVTVVEWPENIVSILPPVYLRVEILPQNGSARRLVYEPLGKRYEDVLEELKSIAHPGS